MRGRGRGAEKGKCNSTSTVTPLPETTEMQTLWSLDSPSKFAMSDDCCYAKVGRKYTMKGTWVLESRRSTWGFEEKGAMQKNNIAESQMHKWILTMPVRFHLEDTKYHTRIFAHFVSPPATARANAKRNHFPHHLLTVAALGGPVGRAGRPGLRPAKLGHCLHVLILLRREVKEESNVTGMVEWRESHTV